MTRAATWSNSDGLDIGYGKNTPHRAGNVHEHYAGSNAGVKSASVSFTFAEMNLCTTGGVINVPVPAGSKVVDVRVLCDTAWTSTGTNTFVLGLTGGTTNLFMTTTVGTSGSMTAGAVLLGDGAGLFGATDTGASELYAFTSADTIDVYTAMADWLTGTATLIVTYI